MTVLRVKFIRGEDVKYISHLDLLKTYERAMRRAAVPLLYTKGFNPHPIMVFGLPLPVGVTSECEYMDVELNDIIRTEKFINTVNRQLPDSLRILAAWEEKENKNIMSVVAQAIYVILVCTGVKTGTKYIKGEINGILNKKSIIIRKKGKKDTKEVDIRPLIYGIEVNECEVEDIESKLASCTSRFKIKITVAAGSRANLNPILFTDYFKTFCEENISIQGIHRTKLLIEKNGIIQVPMKMVAEC